MMRGNWEIYLGEEKATAAMADEAQAEAIFLSSGMCVKELRNRELNVWMNGAYLIRI